MRCESFACEQSSLRKSPYRHSHSPSIPAIAGGWVAGGFPNSFPHTSHRLCHHPSSAGLALLVGKCGHRVVALRQQRLERHRGWRARRLVQRRRERAQLGQGGLRMRGVCPAQSRALVVPSVTQNRRAVSVSCGRVAPDGCPCAKYSAGAARRVLVGIGPGADTRGARNPRPACHITVHGLPRLLLLFAHAGPLRASEVTFSARVARLLTAVRVGRRGPRRHRRQTTPLLVPRACKHVGSSARVFRTIRAHRAAARAFVCSPKGKVVPDHPIKAQSCAQPPHLHAMRKAIRGHPRPSEAIPSKRRGASNSHTSGTRARFEITRGHSGARQNGRREERGAVATQRGVWPQGTGQRCEVAKGSKGNYPSAAL